MGEIYLIRHGQASFGSTNYDELSELGVWQSRILANHFVDVGFIPDAIYCGPMARHRATADEFYRVCSERQIDLPETEIMEEFREYNAEAIIRAALGADPSLMEHAHRIYDDPQSFRKLFGSAMLKWVGGALDSQGVESWESLKERVGMAFETIRMRYDKGGTVVVFTSGGAIAASLANVLGVSGEGAMRLNWQIVNTSVTRYVYDDHKIALAGFNSMEHLRLKRDPSLITLW